MSGWLIGDYGQVLVTVGTDNELPFTVALTVSLYCTPLVTLCVPLKTRRPVPDAYQVCRQVFPCHNCTVAFMDAELSFVKMVREQFAVVPLKERDGNDCGVRATLAAAETGISSTNRSAIINANFFIRFTSFLLCSSLVTMKIVDFGHLI